MIQCDSDEAYCESEKQLKERKGKRETYNLNRHVRDKIQERLDFKFYDFQALEVFLLLSLFLNNIRLYNYLISSSFGIIISMIYQNIQVIFLSVFL